MSPRLFVLGNAGVDLSLPLPRLPMPGETLVGGALSRAPGGKGLNQAVVAARCGLVPVHFLAPLGEDAEADFVAAVLSSESFARLELPRLPGPTDVSILLVAQDGENCIVTSGGRAASLTPDAAARFAARCGPGDHLLLQGNLGEAATMAALACCAGAVILNTAPLLWQVAGLLARCAVVVANEAEAFAITGETGMQAAAALHGGGAAHAIVTLGAAGCAVAGPDGMRCHAALRGGAVDSTGAGDTFCGVLAASLAAGTEIGTAIALAQRAAALTVSRPGAFAALPSVAELHRSAGAAGGD